MAVNPQQELIWRGRLHVGDEPGVYGDAHYPGITSELPITVYRLLAMSTDDLPFELVLQTEDLETFQGYPGHLITIIIHEPDPTQQFHSKERVLATARFTSADNNRKAVSIRPGHSTGPFYISVQLRVDTTVNPGFYDDFVWIRLSLLSDKYYASF